MAVWEIDAPTDEPLWTFEVPYPDEAAIVPHFNIDGSHVIATVAGFDGMQPPAEVGVYVFDARTGEVVQHLRGPECPIRGLFQSGRFLDETRPIAAVASSAEDCSIDWVSGADLWLVDLIDGQINLGTDRPVFTGAWGTPSTLSDDGRYASWNDGYSASGVIDLETGEDVFGTTDGWFAMLNKDGSHLLSGGQRTITLRDIESGTTLWSIEVPATLTDEWFSEDESLIYAGAHDGTVRIWDAATGELLHELNGHRAFNWPHSMSRDNTRLASLSGDRTIKIWDLTAAVAGEVTGFDIEGFTGVQYANFVGDRAAMLLYADSASAFSEPGAAVILNVSSGEIERTFEGYGSQMVRQSSDGALLAGQPFVAPGVLGPVHIRNAETGEVLFELEGWCSFDQDNNQPAADCADNPDAVGDAVWWLEFSPDGTMLAAAGDRSGTAGVWNVETGQRLTWLREHPSSPGAIVVLRFSPTSDLLVAANPGISVFDTTDWSKIASLPPDRVGEWWDLLFTPDGRQLLGADVGKGIVTVDTTTWQFVDGPMPGHQGGVRDIDVNADISLIAAGSSDGFARIWDAQTRELIQAIPYGKTSVNLVHFLDDGHLLVIPQGRPAAVVTTDISELIYIARSRIPRGFTDDECATYHLDPCPNLAAIKGGGG
jgi:WD40 repeat protein